MKARVKAHALREVIESREHVIIMGHSISDVDSLGAAIGVYCAARVLGKKAQIVLNEVTSSLRPLVEGFSEEKGYPADLFIKSEEAILLDEPRYARDGCGCEPAELYRVSGAVKTHGYGVRV